MLSVHIHDIGDLAFGCLESADRPSFQTGLGPDLALDLASLLSSGNVVLVVSTPVRGADGRDGVAGGAEPAVKGSCLKRKTFPPCNLRFPFASV